MKNNHSRLFHLSRKTVIEFALELSFAGLVVFSVAGNNLAQKNSSPDDAVPQMLAEQIEVEKEIRGKQAHSYRIEAEAGDCARLIVQQKGIDVVVAVKNSAGQLLYEVDRPNGSFGREAVTFIAAETGAYLVEVSDYNQGRIAGKYTIRLEKISPSAESDSQRIVAEKLTTVGERLRWDGENKADAQTLEQALAKFQAALTIWENLGDFYEQAVILYALGWTYLPQSRYERATLSFARSLKLALIVGDEYIQMLDYAGIGWSEFYSGNFETASLNFEMTMELARKNNHQSHIGQSLFGLGNIAYMRGQIDEAFDLLVECLRIRQTVNDRRGAALTEITLAKVLVRQKRYESAIDYLHRSLNYFIQSGKKQGEAEAITTLGWTYLADGNNQRAAGFFEQALQIRTKLGDKAGEASARRGLSVALAGAGDFQRARIEVKKVFEILDSLRGESLNVDVRLSFIGSIQEYYDDGISILMQMHEREPNAGYDRAAFELNERSRSRTLLDFVQQKQSNSVKIKNSHPATRKRDLQQQLIENLIVEGEMRTAEKDLAKIRSQRIKVQELLFSLREIEDEINRQSSPNDNRSAAFVASVVPSAEIQQLLGEETVLLEYRLGAERSFLWLATGKLFLAFTLPKREIIEKLVEETRRALLRQKIDRFEGTREFEQKASELSQMLLTPALPYLGKKRLLIVSQGALQYIPFAALPKNAAPLIADHEVSYLPSASLLAFLQKKKKTRFDKEIAIFADPVFSANDARLGKNLAKNPTAEPTAPRLFSSRFEAKNIVSFVPPDKSLLALDTKASRATVIATDLRRYRILHFATHAMIDNEQPELSAVMLSNFNRDGAKTDGLLRSAEIVNLDLNNELVVLSGCRTNLGKNARGEGLLNLSRSFMLAGTSRLLVSLWEVEDKATAELMTRFYRKHLKDKMPASEALRAAQLEIMSDRRWELPFYWSAFVLQGDWR